MPSFGCCSHPLFEVALPSSSLQPCSVNWSLVDRFPRLPLLPACLLTRRYRTKLEKLRIVLAPGTPGGYKSRNPWSLLKNSNSKSLDPSPAPAPSVSDSTEFVDWEEEANRHAHRVQSQVIENKGSPHGLQLVLATLRQFQRKIFKQLASFPLAIGELFAIAGLCALGTFIEQGENPEYYFQKYSENHPAFGFLTGQWVLWLSLDHVFSSPYFLGLLVLLGASLVACTWTRQLPMVKVARRWSFLKSGAAASKLEVSDTLYRARISDLAVLLMADGYQVFVQGPALYAFKGLAGRFAPIGVHAALLMIMGGATLSATGGYHGSVMVPQGLNFIVGEVVNPSGVLSRPISALNVEVHVNNFSIDTYPSGEVAQYHSDLSLRDMNGKEVFRKTISVNDPLRFGGVTMYQTDWAISAIQVHVDGAGPFNLAGALLQGGDNKLFGTFLPLKDMGRAQHTKGISILARDLQSVVIYDSEGKFVGVRRPGSNRPITVDGMQVLVDDIIGSTGLQIKMDPGVPVVYAGFGALMLTTCISYLSHSQVWALQEGNSVFIGGKTNRAKQDFKKELNELLDYVPEVVCMTPKEGHITLSVVNHESNFEPSEVEQVAETKEVLAALN